MFKLSLLCLSLLAVFASQAKKNLHPNEGELICFEFTNIDCGQMYSFDDTTVAFPFVNCSGHELSVKEISCNNSSQEQIFSVIGTYKEKIVTPGGQDTLFFKKKDFYRVRDDLLDVSFTVSFNEFPIRQQLNIFVEFIANMGSLEVLPIHLPTVERGDSIIFTSIIENMGDSPVTLSSKNSGWPNSYYHKIKLLEKNPIVIHPHEKREIEFMLRTDNLLNEYTGGFSFNSNEDVRKHKRITLHYFGKLISQGYPSIIFDTLVQTLYITQREACNFEFWFENNGDTPLIISACKTSCGCLVASWPHEAIMPGNRDVIEIKYDSNRIGPINKSCTVQTNASEQPIVLRVKGKVKALSSLSNPTSQ
jgi:hypothetical protein